MIFTEVIPEEPTSTPPEYIKKLLDCDDPMPLFELKPRSKILPIDTTNTGRIDTIKSQIATKPKKWVIEKKQPKIWYNPEELFTSLAGNSEIYKGYHQTLDIPVLIKTSQSSFLTEDEDIRIEKEAKLMDRLFVTTKGIVPRIFDICSDQKKLCIVMEYIEGKTLMHYIREAKDINPKLIYKVGLRLTEALQAMHENKIMHGDLQPKNIIINDKEEIRLVDFGLSPKAMLSLTSYNDEYESYEVTKIIYLLNEMVNKVKDRATRNKLSKLTDVRTSDKYKTFDEFLVDLHKAFEAE